MNSKIRNTVLTAAVAAAWGLAGSVLAAPGVIFDVNGPAGPNSSVGVGADRIFVDSFDWGPGNTVASDAVPIKSAGALSIFLLSHASLSSLKFDSSNTMRQLDAGHELTYQMSTNAKVVTGATDLHGVFSPNTDAIQPVTFFTMYHSTSMDSNAVTGCGYGAVAAVLPGCSAATAALTAGTPILTGTAELVSMTWSPDAVQTVPNTLLDTNGADNQSDENAPGGPTRTISATGSAAYKITVTFAHPAYFLSPINALVTTADLDHTGTNGDGFTPGTTNPSDQVVGRVMEDTTSAATEQSSLDASYGTGRINGDPTACGVGSGPDNRCDLHMVSDTATGVLAEVPEPGSMALMGLGLGLLGFGARRRLKKA